MPEEQFARMREIIGAPSPIGLEGAMTHGVLLRDFERYKLPGWAAHTFRGNAGIAFDTAPQRKDALSVMVVGHADKIRMQVRSVGDDGKIWINSDSFLPATLLGHEVMLFTEDPEKAGLYRILRGGTVEAIGAIHFAEPEMRTGKKGISPEMLYLELQLHGEDRKKQVERLGVKAGDPILFDRPIRRGFAKDTFVGAYLDNGLGCFVASEVMRLVAGAGGLRNLRLLGAAAAYEEIGRFGSRVLAQEFRPDVLIAVDVAHDYRAAPGVGEKRFTPNTMGEGFSLAQGAICNPWLNSTIASVARERKIPMQWKVVGIDTGTDAMASVLAGIDSAATSIGFPIRNMHTMSECGHTGDVLAAIHVIFETLRRLDAMNGGAGVRAEDFRRGHPRLDQAGGH